MVVLCFLWTVWGSLESRDKTGLLYSDQRCRNIPGFSRSCSKGIFCYLTAIVILLSVPQTDINNSQDIPLHWHGIRTHPSPVLEVWEVPIPSRKAVNRNQWCLERTQRSLSPISPLMTSAQMTTPPEEQIHLWDFPLSGYSSLSLVAEELKDSLSLLLMSPLRQTQQLHEPFQSEGWGGVLIKLIILSWKGYLQRHLRALGRCCADRLSLKIVILTEHVKPTACVDYWTQVTDVLHEEPDAV